MRSTGGGSVGWMAAIVVFAAVVTPLIAMAEGWIVWCGAPAIRERSLGLLALAPAVLVAALTFGPLLIRSRVSVVARLAVIVPVLHVGLMVAIYAIWQSADIPLIRDGVVDLLAASRVPLLLDGETLGVGAALAAALIAAALIHNAASRRRLVPRWLRPAVIFSVSYLLLLGLWMPVAAVIWGSHEAGQNGEALLATLVVPGILAAAVTPNGRPKWWTRNAAVIGVGLAVALVVALAMRFNSSHLAHALFINLIPVLMIAAMVALAAVVALALCQWRELRFHRADGLRPAPWVQRGIVETDAPPGTPIGFVRFLGWLGGFRTELAPFSIRTEEGHRVAVPRGSQLSAAPGIESVGSSSGDAVVALRVGDPVAAAGYEAPVGDGPFRASGAPVPSDRGVLVFGPHEPPLVQSLILLLWRPCALYLLASMTAIIPALLGYDGM